MDCSTLGFPVHCRLPELDQIHVHWWCPPTISCSLVPFSSCLQSFSASGSFLMSQFFTLSGQSIGVSPLASVLPMNIQDWFPLELTGWISLLSRVLSRVFFNTTVQKHQFFSIQLSLWSNSHIHTWLLESFDYTNFNSKVMSLHFNSCLGWLVIAFLPRSKHLLISWLQSPSAVTVEPKKMKSVTFHCFPSICHEVMGLDAMILVFWMLRFKPTFSLSSFTYIKRLFIVHFLP